MTDKVETKPVEDPKKAAEAESKAVPEPALTEDQDKILQDILDRIEDAEDKRMEELKRIRKDHFSYTPRINGEDLAEGSVTRINQLFEKQRAELEALYRGTIIKFREAYMVKLKASRLTATGLDALHDEIMNPINAEADSRLKKLEGSMQAFAALDGVPKITSAREAYEFVNNMEEAEKVSNGTVKNILDKLQKGETVSRGDYETVCNLLVNKSPDAVAKSVDQSGVGLLLKYMKPDQRKTLVEIFMDQPFGNQVGDLIEAFLGTGVLTDPQGKELYEKAKGKNLIAQEKFNELMAKFENGTYLEARKKVEAVVREKSADFHTYYADNVANRFSGAPLLGAVISVWGTTVAVMNFMASWGHKGDGLASLAANPWFLAGVAGSVGGLGATTSLLKIGNPAFGGGVISEAAEKIMTILSEDPEKNKYFQEIKTMYLSDRSQHFRDYLEKGGMKTLIKLRKEKGEKEKRNMDEVTLTFNEILAAQSKDESENGKACKKSLDYLALLPENEKDGYATKLTRLANLADDFNDEENGEAKTFGEVINKIRTEQGLT